MKTFPAFVLAACMACPLAAAAEPKPFTNGEIRLRVISGPQEMEFRYRLRGTRMRIDRPGEIIPAPPVNLLDLASRSLTILHPHNGTWQKVPAAKLQPRQLGLAGLPNTGPQPGPQPGPGITPPDEAGETPVTPTGPLATGPQLPEFPRPPGRSPLPHMPAVLPSGHFPGPPALPQVPVIPPVQVSPVQLKATPEQREIHGYPCTRYTLDIPREGEMSLWLAGPGLFPPFHLLETDLPGRSRRRDELAEVPALLRDRDLFPLLAELKGDGGSPLLRWEVTAITPGTGEDGELFLIPAGFQRLVPP